MRNDYQPVAEALINATKVEIDKKDAEIAQLRGAIRKAGFSVMETSGDWSIHDVSEHGKAEEQRTAEIITHNLDLEDAVETLRAAVTSVVERINFADEVGGNSIVTNEYRTTLNWALESTAGVTTRHGKQ